MKKINLDTNKSESGQNQEKNHDLAIEESEDQHDIEKGEAETAVDVSQEIVHNRNSVSKNQSGESQSTQNPDMKKKQKKLLIALCTAAILAGTGTGFGAFKLSTQQAQTTAGPEPARQVAEGQIKKGDVFGMQDSELFSDTAQGYLESGGINGEGSHRLLRPGGESQTVYLTSTVTNLESLVGSEVKVWGETYKGQKAGWLMDVGKVEILEVEGEAPFEEEL